MENRETTPHLTSLPKQEEETLIPSPTGGGGLGWGRGEKSERDKTTIQRARNLRKNSTEAERKLWYHLRRKEFQGIKFRRQYAVGKFITDFCSIEKKLIIELDGGQHGNQQKYDNLRTAFLEKEDFRVLRFWNNDVMENINGVLEVIKNNLSHPHPNPPPQAGEGKKGR